MNSPGTASRSGSSVHMPGKVKFFLIFSMKCLKLKVKSVEAVNFRCRHLGNVPEEEISSTVTLILRVA